MPRGLWSIFGSVLQNSTVAEAKPAERNKVAGFAAVMSDVTENCRETISFSCNLLSSKKRVYAETTAVLMYSCVFWTHTAARPAYNFFQKSIVVPYAGLRPFESKRITAAAIAVASPNIQAITLIMQ